MKSFSILILSLFISFSAMAQSTKWINKTKKTVFSIISYNDEGKIHKKGNGVFISEDGIGITDYEVMKGATKAVVIMPDGKELSVIEILGVNEMYDLAKFKVNTLGKKVEKLIISNSRVLKGEAVYVLPYSTQDKAELKQTKIVDTTSIDNKYLYYTIDVAVADNMVSCPLVNEKGELVALAQKSTKEGSNSGYAIDAKYAEDLTISILSLNDKSLQNIGIAKAIPDKEEDALIYMMMSSSILSGEEHEKIINQFISKYPNSSDGYLRRAKNNLYKAISDINVAKSIDEDLSKALQISKKKEEVLYHISEIVTTYLSQGVEDKYQKWTLDYALKNIDEAISLEKNISFLKQKANVLFMQDKNEDALKIYSEINSSKDATPESFITEAKILEKLNRPDEEVLALLDSCIARCNTPVLKSEAIYYLLRADKLSAMKRHRQAIKDFDVYYEAVNGQVNSQFYYLREQELLKIKHYQRALEDIERAIELEPEDNSYRVEYGALLLRVGKYDDAIAQFNHVIKNDPKYAEGYRLIGICYVQKKEMSKACEYFHKAKEMGDQNTDELIKKYCK